MDIHWKKRRKMSRDNFWWAKDLSRSGYQSFYLALQIPLPLAHLGVYLAMTIL
jgi:hypothetical protein